MKKLSVIVLSILLVSGCKEIKKHYGIDTPAPPVEKYPKSVIVCNSLGEYAIEAGGQYLFIDDWISEFDTKHPEGSDTVWQPLSKVDFSRKYPSWYTHWRIATTKNIDTARLLQNWWNDKIPKMIKADEDAALAAENAINNERIEKRRQDSILHQQELIDVQRLNFKPCQ